MTLVARLAILGCGRAKTSRPAAPRSNEGTHDAGVERHRRSLGSGLGMLTRYERVGCDPIWLRASLAAILVPQGMAYAELVAYRL